MHCWWECTLVQPLWKSVWNVLKKLKMELPFDPVIPLLGLYPKKPESPIQKNLCTPMFLGAYLNLNLFLFLFKFSCLHFPTTTFLCPTQPHLSPSILSSFGFVHGSLYTCSFMTLPLLSIIIPLHPPFWSLSVRSMFPCLWFNFVHEFRLFIRLLLQ